MRSTIYFNKRHESRIYGFIYSKIADRDISNDIFQDTFIKVIKTLKSNSYNEEGKVLPGEVFS
jgi:RNA polymerase sigma-70 factor (ECF subfamily)